MFRMNGHDFCSRQIISTYIHVGNVVMPWQFLGIHAFTALVLPCTSMAGTTNVQDERSWQLLGIHAFAALVLPALHFCSRQIISTYIHVGNVVMPWQFLGIHAFTALVLPARHFCSRQIISIYIHIGNIVMQ